MVDGSEEPALLLLLLQSSTYRCVGCAADRPRKRQRPGSSLRRTSDSCVAVVFWAAPPVPATGWPHVHVCELACAGSQLHSCTACRIATDGEAPKSTATSTAAPH